MLKKKETNEMFAISVPSKSNMFSNHVMLPLIIKREINTLEINDTLTFEVSQTLISCFDFFLSHSTRYKSGCTLKFNHHGF